MKPGDEVIHISSGRRLTVKKCTAKRVRMVDHLGIEWLASYRNVKPVPSVALFVISASRTGISDARRQAELEITFRYPERIEIGEISFSDRLQ